MIAPQLALTDKGRLAVLTRKLERLSADSPIHEQGACVRPIDLPAMLRCTLNSERQWEMEYRQLTAEGRDKEAGQAAYFAGELHDRANWLLDDLTDGSRRMREALEQEERAGWEHDYLMAAYHRDDFSGRTRAGNAREALGPKRQPHTPLAEKQGGKE